MLGLAAGRGLATSRLVHILGVAAYFDLSGESREAVRAAIVLARAFGARLQVIRIVEDPLSAGWTAEMAAQELPRLQEAIEVETRDALSGLLPDAGGGADAGEASDVSLAVGIGSPVDELLAWAGRPEVDLLVIGAKPLEAEGGTADLAETLVRQARCSVLMVRPGTSS